MPLLSRSCLIVLALSVFLPSILPAASPPDCQINYRFSNRAFDQADGITNFITAGATPAFSNLSNQCTSWVAAYNSEGFSVVSIAFQSAPRATTPSGMTIGAWATFGGTTISGSNPGTSTSGNTYIATGYFPFLRINATTLTGTGSVDVLILGWKAPGTVSSLSGGTATAPSGTGCAAAASSAFTATRVLQPGTGISITNGDCTGDPAIAINTAVALTRSTAQANTSLYCRSSTGNTTGTCLLTPSLTQYDRGMEIILDSDTVNTTTYTINIDSVGQKSVLSRSGGALTAGDVPANKPVLIVYDGTQFILQSGGGSSLTGGNQISIISNVIDSNPHDFTKVSIKDNFCIKGAYLGTDRDNIGNLGWYMDSTGAGVVSTVFPGSGGLVSGLCRYRIQLVGTSSGDTVRIFTHNDSPIFIPNTSTNLKISFVFSLTDVTNLTFNIGWGAQSTPTTCFVSSTNCVAVTFDPGLDSFFKFRSCAASCTALTSTIAPTNNLITIIQIYVTTAGTIFFSVNGETPQSIATNISSSTLAPNWILATNAVTTTRTLDLSGFAFTKQ